jgi:hypothetical protein
MRLILLSILLFIGLNSFAQNINNIEVKPKGIYAEINLSNDIMIIQRLSDTSASNAILIDSVEKNANKYTPPVLYVLSSILFNQKKYNDACFWFYVAQLRARYDVNRCTDKTANANTYNLNYGPAINEYAFKHMDSLKVIVQKVVNYVRINEELYDQRWINLTGMNAMTASISDKQSDKKLSIDKRKWPAVKEKTINDYYEDFNEVTNRDIVVDKNTLLGKDYRLFQNTIAWELAKAVEDGDTSKIKLEVQKSKSLLSFREQRFGQSLLQMAVKTTNYSSAKALVELGADPNMQDRYFGESPLMAAADIGINGHDSDPRFMKLLLEHGGNPNAEENGSEKQGGLKTPLLIACSNGDINYVKLLVDAGAEINHANKYGATALGEAVIIARNPDIVLYLLNKGVDFKRPMEYGTIITDGLREWLFDLNSEDYKKKMEIVDFSKKKWHGLLEN